MILGICDTTIAYLVTNDFTKQFTIVKNNNQKSEIAKNYPNLLKIVETLESDLLITGLENFKLKYTDVEITRGINHSFLKVYKETYKQYKIYLFLQDNEGIFWRKFFRIVKQLS